MPHDELRAARIVMAALAIAATVALAVGAVFVLLHAWHVPASADRVGSTRNTAAPALQSAPQPDLRRERAQARQRLESAGWVDRPAGIAHIPIEAAMSLLAQGPVPSASAAGESP